MSSSNWKPLVDELGAVRAQIADLEVRERALKDQLVAVGPGAYEGDSYRATVNLSTRRTLDMEAVREKLSAQFISRHTRITPVTIVRTAALVVV